MRLSKYSSKLRHYLQSLPVRKGAIRTKRRAWQPLQLEQLEDRVTPTGTWTPLITPDPLGAQQLLLLPSGAVMVAGGSDSASANWYSLVPDSSGNYYDGTFNTLQPMNVPRLFYTSDVLPNGDVLVLGGEYSGPSTLQTATPTGEIYNPTTNSWQLITPCPQTYAPSTVIAASEVGNTVTMTTNSIVNSPFKLAVGASVVTSGFAPNALNGTFTVTAASTFANTTTFSFTDPNAFNATPTTFGSAAQGVFGDDPSEVLSNGTVLAGALGYNTTYIYNPATTLWSTTTGSKQLNDRSDEETWVKLPPLPGQTDGDILSYNVYASQPAGPGSAQIYNPATQTWSLTGPVPVYLSDSGNELGPAFLLPNGNVFQIGANNNTAIYNPTTNSWVAGPTFTAGFGAADAPGVELPDGEVLFAANIPNQNTPSEIFDYNPYDPTEGPNGTITQVTLPSALAQTLTNNTNSTDSDYMLALPNGNVLFSDSTRILWEYNPNVTPLASSAPTITGITQLSQGSPGNPASVVFEGTQLNGISEGANYGDDAEMASNYPLLQIHEGNTIQYFTTSNWSSTDVATGNRVTYADANVFSISPDGAVQFLSAVANGISSPLVLNIEMAPDLDNITLRADPNNLQDLQILENGAPTIFPDVPFSDFSSVIVSGGVNQTNSVNVDYTYSFFDNPVIFDGATIGATNNLVVTDATNPNPLNWTVTYDEISSRNDSEVDYQSLQSVTLATGAGGGSIDVASTGTTTNIGASGPTSITVGDNGSVGLIQGSLYLYNLTNLNTITVDDSADAVSYTAVVSTQSSGGGLPLPVYGSISGLSEGNIVYVYSDTSSVLFKTGTANETVDVEGTGGLGSTPLTVQGNSPNTTVTVGNNNTLSGITGALTITNPLYYTQVNIDDSADTASYPNIKLNATQSAATLSGLGPTTITMGPDDLAGLTINGGSGTNVYTIVNTENSTVQGGDLTTLNTGTGNDTINVQSDSGAGLTVAEQGGSSTVNIGFNNSLADIFAPLTVDSDAASNVVVNASADGANYANVVLAKNSLTGLAGAAINFQGTGHSLTVNAGNGQNTYAVNGTPFSQSNTLNSGNGYDTIDVNDTSYPLTLNTGSHTTSISLGQSTETVRGIAGAVTIAGSTPGMDLLFVYDQNDTAGGTVTVSNTGFSGLSTLPMVSYGASILADLNINAGSGGTKFVLGSTPTATWNVSAQGTGNTLVGFNSNTNWVLQQIAGAPDDYLTAGGTGFPVYFSGIQTLQGGSGNDDFQILGSRVFGGLIDGGAGSNTLDFSQTTYPVSVVISGPGTLVGQQGSIFNSIIPSNPMLTGTFNNIGTFINASEQASLVVTTNSDAFSHAGTSLRDAIATANSDTAQGIPATISFAPTLNGTTIALSQGVLEIKSGSAPLSIVGTLSLTGIIEVAVSGAGHSGVFQVDQGATATIANLTIEDGSAGNGGGFNNSGTLTLDDDDTNNNTASGNGGGIYNVGTLTVNGGTLDNNSANSPSSSSGLGGGAYNDGTLTINNAQLYGNTAAGTGGGAIYNYNAGTLALSFDDIAQNSTSGYYGGALYNFGGAVTIGDSGVTSNSAGYQGGGIYNYFGTMWLNNDEFVLDTATGNVFSGDAGGAVYNEGLLTITNSTLNNNTAKAYGGGLFNDGGGSGVAATLTNDTITANTTMLGDGGGIYNEGPLTLTNDTIAGNTAQATGGGIYETSGEGPLVMENTILAGNVGRTAFNNTYYPDISGSISNSPQASENNLIGSDPSNSSGLFNNSNGNQVGFPYQIDPLLGPLTSNGGPTQTMALEAGSPAIGAGAAPTTINASGGGINSSTTSVEVSDAATIASTPGDFVIVVDSEQMLVTNVNLSTNTLTVQRGYNGTMPASHLTGEGVYLTTDQRGDSRLNTNTPDIGAYQSPITQNPGLVVTTVSDGPTHNGVSLRDAITLANSMSAAGEAATITFARQLYGYPIVLDQGLLELTAGTGLITINGGGQMTVSGSYTKTTVFRVDSGANVDLTGLTIEDGSAVNGAGVDNAGTLALANDTLSGNAASGDGGAVYNNGALSVLNSTFSGNSAVGAGPDVYNAGGTATIGNATAASGILVVPGIYVAAGTLEADGHLFPPANVSAAAGATVDGDAFIAGPLSIGGTLTAGDGGASTGQLALGNFSFGSGGTLAIALNGAHAGAGYDQIVADGTVNLNNAMLNLSLGAGFTPTLGESFDILVNDSGAPINGTFSNLPEGAVITVSGQSFGITYHGGASGQDVVLTDELPTTATLSDNGPNPSTFGQSVNFSVTLTGGVSNGEFVTLKDLGSGAVVGTGIVNGGTAPINVSSLVAGVHSLVAIYGGDATLSGSTSNTVTQTVDQAPSFTSANADTFTVNAFNSVSVTAGGYPVPNLSENPADILPPGVSFDTSTDTLNGTPALGSVGTYTLHFTASNSFGSVGQTFTLTVGKATPVITWNTPSPITYGTALDNTELNATANVLGTFVYTPAAGTVLPAVDTPLLSVTFMPTDTADYATTTQSVVLEVDPAPLTVTANPQTIVYGSPIPTLTYTATGFVNGDTSLPGSLSTIATSTSPVGAYDITQGDLGALGVDEDGDIESNYAITYNDAYLTITQATPIVTWATPAPINSATPLGAVQLDATANVPGAFSYSPPAGTFLSPGMQTLNVTFTPTDSTEYQTVNDSVTINVNQAINTTTTLIPNSPSPSLYGQPLSFTVDVTGGVPDGETVNLEDSNTNAVIATGQLSGGAVTIPVNNLPAGVYNLVAVYPGDSTYATSTSNTAPQEVDQAPVFTSANQTTFTVGAFGSFAVTAGGYPATTLSEDPSDTLPSNVTFDPLTGILSGTPALGTVGVYTLHFTADNGIGNDATQTFTLTVGKAAPIVTWTMPLPITYGTPLDNTELDAFANVVGTFNYTPAAGTVLPAGMPTLSVTFMPTDTADYSSVTQSVPLEVDPAPLTVDANSNQTITYGTAVPALTFTAFGLVNGDTNASLTGALATTATPTSPVGAYDITQGTLTDPNYQITYNDASLTITQATPVITWATPVPIGIGTPLGSIQLNATANVQGSFVYAPPAGTVLPAGTQTLTVDFIPNDATDYMATTASVQLQVTNTNTPPSLAGLPAVNGSGAVINIVSATGNGTTATITTDGTPHGFWVGELVRLTGTTPGGPNGLAGAVTVTGVPSATTFQFASTYSGTETLSGATATASLAGAQRSMVDSIVYNFTEAVNLTAAAFTITAIQNNPGSTVGIVPTVNVAAVPFTNEWVVTFTDPVNNSVVGHSIANGAYTIAINPAAVTAVSGGQNLSAGETDTFYRLYGDVTGVQSVKNVDANAFNRAWGNFYYTAGYNAALDYNDDGKFTNIDANAFNRAFNTRYSVVTSI